MQCCYLISLCTFIDHTLGEKIKKKNHRNKMFWIVLFLDFVAFYSLIYMHIHNYLLYICIYNVYKIHDATALAHGWIEMVAGNTGSHIRVMQSLKFKIFLYWILLLFSSSNFLFVRTRLNPIPNLYSLIFFNILLGLLGVW